MRIYPFHPNPTQPKEHQVENKIFKHSLVFPTLFLTLIWLVKLWESVLRLDFTKWGVYPLKFSGLKGVLTSPLIHSDWEHLIVNSASLFVLMVGLFYFYRQLAYRIFFIIYFLSGLLVWNAARSSWHIGASGVVYGLASFLFLSGIIRKDARLLSLSLVVVFLYGGMFWGIFPIKPNVSWEGHLWGAVSGILLAIYYRKQGPKQYHYEWEEEEDGDEILNLDSDEISLDKDSSEE